MFRHQVLISFFTLSLLFGGSPTRIAVPLSGLNSRVQIIKDEWGVSHIYATNEADLFFAQGFNAARDGLFQFEVWRRQATGTVAEITGKRDVRRDVGTRLFRFRHDITEEMNHYHPRGDKIIPAYVAGVKAYIGQTEKDPGLLPAEFDILGILPQEWTPEIVISRHQGLLGNITRELNHGRAVYLLGEEKVKELNWFHPWGEPDISLDPQINGALLTHDILGLYNAFRRPVIFASQDVRKSIAKRTNHQPLTKRENSSVLVTGTVKWMIWAATTGWCREILH